MEENSSTAGAVPFDPALPSSPARSAKEDQEIQRACNVAVGAGVLPSRGRWSAYKGHISDYIPNYWTIESDDYTDSGFSITGFIHDDDARVMGSVTEMREALQLFLKQWNACGSNSDFGRYFSNVREAAEAALAKATATVSEGEEQGSPRSGEEPPSSPSRERVEVLEEALRPFVTAFEAARERYARRYPNHADLGRTNFDAMPDEWTIESRFSMGVYRVARATLKAPSDG